MTFENNEIDLRVYYIENFLYLITSKGYSTNRHGLSCIHHNHVTWVYFLTRADYIRLTFGTFILLDSFSDF